MNKSKRSAKTKEQKGLVNPKYDIVKLNDRASEQFFILHKDRIKDLTRFSESYARYQGSTRPILDGNYDSKIEVSISFDVSKVVNFVGSVGVIHFDNIESIPDSFVLAIFELSKYFSGPDKTSDFGTKSKKKSSTTLLKLFENTDSNLRQIEKSLLSELWVTAKIKSDILLSVNHFSKTYLELKKNLKSQKMITSKIDSCFNELQNLFESDEIASDIIDSLIVYMRQSNFCLIYRAEKWSERIKAFHRNRSNKKK